eukprot:4805585-Pyramimonas_sp.AAC.1
MGRKKGSEDWGAVEDRVDMLSARDVDECDTLATFVQPPRVRSSGGTSYLCTPLTLSDYQMTTMGSKARNTYCEGSSGLMFRTS